MGYYGKKKSAKKAHLPPTIDGLKSYLKQHGDGRVLTRLSAGPSGDEYVDVNATKEVYARIQDLYEQNWKKRGDVGAKIGSWIWGKKLKNLDRALEKKYGRLESTTAATASIAGIAGALFLLSANITGNVVGVPAIVGSSVIGAVLLVLGIIAGFYWVSNRKTK